MESKTKLPPPPLSSRSGSATGNESIVETDVPLNAVRILMFTYMAFLTIFEPNMYFLMEGCRTRNRNSFTANGVLLTVTSVS